MEEETRTCCQTCKYWVFEEIDRGHICCNPDSDSVADWVEYDDACIVWEGKDETH
jgi:hypothetical protein